MRELEYTLRVSGAGPIRLGPFEVKAGTSRGEAALVEFTAAAPPGRQAEVEAPGVLDLRTPSGLGASQEPDTVVRMWW